MAPRTIFPPFHPHADWRAVDDRIRGGSSISHLDSVSTHSARFWGNLDIKTLGGAGFASQCHTFTPHSLRLCKDEYKGLSITFDVTPKDVADKPKHFTLVLKSSIPPLRPDGRRESTLSYEFTFANASSTTTESATRQCTIVIPWSDFSATYRGRPITPKDPQYSPLDPGSIDKEGKEQGGIAELSLMCRSDFGKQEGEFELVVHKIEAVPLHSSSSSSYASGHAETEKKTLNGETDGDLEKQVWDEAVRRRRQSRFPAVSWKTLGLVTVVCIGLSVLATRWLAKL